MERPNMIDENDNGEVNFTEADDALDLDLENPATMRQAIGELYNLVVAYDGLDCNGG
jgi:hypothetical protein